MAYLMKDTLKKLFKRDDTDDFELSTEQLKLEVDALFAVLADLYGPDKLILKASKLDALGLMRSEDLGQRVQALSKLINDDPTERPALNTEQIPAALEEIQERIAEIIAKRSVEDRLNQAVAIKMQERHEEYLKEIKNQVLKETAGPENAQTLKKLARIEKMNATKPLSSAIEILRPQTPEEIIGQESAMQALLAKLLPPIPSIY